MNNSSAPDIRLAGVEKRFTADERTVLAVDRTDLSIRAGEFLVLLGPSGCGKTTMLRMVAGLIRPSAGTIYIGPHDLWLGGQRNSAVTKELGVVFQDANLFPWYSVERNVALPLKLRGIEGKAPRQGAGIMRTGRHWRLRGCLASSTLRRHAPARGDRARPVVRSPYSAHGRALWRPRRDHQGSTQSRAATHLA